MSSVSAADARQPASAPQPGSNIHLSLADDGGWWLRTEQGGRTPATEHFTDWHRLERRIAVIRGRIGVPLAFAAARLLHAGRFDRHAHHARVGHTEQ